MHINNNSCLTDEPLVIDLLFWVFLSKNPLEEDPRCPGAHRSHRKNPHFSNTSPPSPFWLRAILNLWTLLDFLFPQVWQVGSSPSRSQSCQSCQIRQGLCQEALPLRNEWLWGTYGIISDDRLSDLSSCLSTHSPNNKFAVKAAHTCTDMQVRWPIPAQDGSVQSGKLQHDQKKL